MDREPVINEALELALEAIDRETLNANNKPQQQQQQQQQPPPQQTETPNKTDEEKNRIQKRSNSIQQQQQILKMDEMKQGADIVDLDLTRVTTKTTTTASRTNEEATIAKEPIYENIISAASIHEVEAVEQTTMTTMATTATTTTATTTTTKTMMQMQKMQKMMQSIPKETNQNYKNINNNNNNSNNSNSNSNNSNQINSNSNNKQQHNQSNNNNNNTNIPNNSSQNNLAGNVKTTTTATATAATTMAKAASAAEGITRKGKATATVENGAALDDNATTPTATDVGGGVGVGVGVHDSEPYYQVPKSSEPYYDAPKHLRPIPVYENIEIFYSGLEAATLSGATSTTVHMEPPKEKPPPPPTESPPPMRPAASSHDDEIDSVGGANTDTWSSDNTYETIATRRHATSAQTMPMYAGEHPSPPIKRLNSTKRIKKELRNKRSSFLGIEAGIDDEDTYLELTVAPPPDMAQLLQEERRLEKQMYIKAGLCDSSDTGESRDSGVSENHSRQSSEHYTNSSEEHDPQLDTPPHSLNPNEVIYQNETTATTTSLLSAAQTPLLQTVKGNSAESWTESATVAAAASQSLSEATATANAKILSIEEQIREQEEVLRVERELLHFSQEELKRQRENLLLRENLARRELQHGAKMLMSVNRRSLQDLHGGLHGGGGVIGNGMLSAFQPPAAKLQQLPQQQLPATTLQQHQQQQQQQQHQQQQQQPQQIYANLPNLQTQYYQVETDYRKSMSDLNEFSKRLMLPPTPPTKPMRAMHIATNGHHEHAEQALVGRQRHSLNMQNGGYGGSLVKIATAEHAPPTAAPRAHGGNYVSNNSGISNGYHHHQSAQNLSQAPPYHHNSNGNLTATNAMPGNMTRNTLHALSATPKPKYTDGWVQVQNRKSYESKSANDAAWLLAHQQKRKSMPDAAGCYQAPASAYNGNHWLVQEAEQRRLIEQHQEQQQQRRTLPAPSVSNNNHSVVMPTKSTVSNGKPLPDSIIQTLTERVQSKGIGERKRFDNAYSQINAVYQANHAAHRHHNSNSNSNSNHNELKSNGLQVKTNTNNTNNNNNINTNKNSNHNHSANAHAHANGKDPQDKVLSVSGKKKCSHCGDELGRGAAMIIESLLLFYHINCFKCCVCHVQLGDGLYGTDVRVRNQKLHCQNCYSSDDGIKFSCV